jgi:hypothetical protein
VRSRHTHTQHSGQDAEAKGRVEDHSFAVDTRRDRAVGIDLEGRNGPLLPRTPDPPARTTA